jgi:hypothetical protein
MTAPEGMYFIGWSLFFNPEHIYKEGDVFTPSGRDYIFTALWYPSYTITFSAGTGSGTPPPSQTAVPGEAITLPGQGSMTGPEGKSFIGWSLSSNSELIYEEGDVFTPYKDCTFTAL